MLKFNNHFNSQLNQTSLNYYFGNSSSSGGGGIYGTGILEKDYFVYYQCSGVHSILNYKGNLKLLYQHYPGPTGRWAISYYDDATDEFIQYNTWGDQFNNGVENGILWFYGGVDYIYRLPGTPDDGISTWNDSDPSNISNIIANGLQTCNSSEGFDGYLYVGGKGVSTYARIVRSISGGHNTFINPYYWSIVDHLDPGDSKYTTPGVHTINGIDGQLFWGTSWGQIWGDSNGGVAPLFDFNPGIITLNHVRNIVKCGNEYVASSQFEVATSPNGVNWTKQFVPVDLDEIHKVEVIDGVVFLLGRNTNNRPAIWTSLDCLTWSNFYETVDPTQNGEFFYSVYWDGSYFWCADLNIKKITSSKN